jgi:rod shape-determining protein MreC
LRWLRSALVVLLTDLNSRIPVLVEPKGDLAILAGDNSASPRLNFLQPGVTLSVGQRVVTSGHGGIFPPGLVVGVVSEIGDRTPRVAPAADLRQIDFVRVLDYGPGGFAGPPTAAGRRSGG